MSRFSPEDQGQALRAYIEILEKIYSLHSNGRPLALPMTQYLELNERKSLSKTRTEKLLIFLTRHIYTLFSMSVKFQTNKLYCCLSHPNLPN